jgi:hypothetical protein
MAGPEKKLGGLRLLAVPLSLSLTAHGLLVLVLWFSPCRSGPVAQAISDTRIGLETCLLDPGPPPAPYPAPAPGELEMKVAPSFVPRMIEGPPPAQSEGSGASPVLGSGRPEGEGAPGSPISRGTGSRLFLLPAMVRSVVYVIDRSVSMGPDDKLAVACQELLASLRRLPPSTHFQVIAYNLEAEPLVLNGQAGFLRADSATVEQVARLLEHLPPAGGTNHGQALRRGLALHPEVLYFVTDADELSSEDIQAAGRLNQGQTIIHTIELTRRRSRREDSSLALLANRNGGTFRQVKTMSDGR